MKRFDICHGRPIKNTDKKYWTKLGTAFCHDDGGISLIFDYAPPTGEYINLFEAKTRDEQGPGQGPGQDEDVPF